MAEGMYRLVTRSDFDGVVCGVLSRELDMIDGIKFVHPKDMQDGTILVADTDISTNLPYVKGVHLAFDHHASEIKRLGSLPKNYIVDPHAPSAARVVFRHYGGAERFPRVSEDMMGAVDKTDSGQFTEIDILRPEGWVQLNYLLDARTGLGRYRSFRISNYDLMLALVEACRTAPVDQILALPDVAERVRLYEEHAPSFQEQLQRCTRMEGATGVVDLRNEDSIFVGNRFMVYALNPSMTISVHVLWGLEQLNTVFAVGKSVTNRTSKVDIGALMLEYGGGGHANAGTCQVENDEADRVLGEILGRLAEAA